MRRTATASLLSLVLGGICFACVGLDPVPITERDDTDASSDSATDGSGTPADSSPPPPPSESGPPINEDATASGGPCSADVDLCRPQGADAGSPTFDPNAYTMYTMPEKPKAGQPFDLYIVTKNLTLMSPGLLKDGVICYGGGLHTACPSPGNGCVGWKVGLFKGVNEAAGTYGFAINDPKGTGCEGATIASLTVVVAN